MEHVYIWKEFNSISKCNDSVIDKIQLKSYQRSSFKKRETKKIKNNHSINKSLHTKKKEHGSIILPLGCVTNMINLKIKWISLDILYVNTEKKEDNYFILMVID